MVDSPTPCIGCGRQYGHWPDCGLQELHQDVDRLAAAFGIACVKTALLTAGSESQQTTFEWSHATFGHLFKTIRQRAVALLEENVETALAAGLSPSDIREVVEVPISKMKTSGDLGDLALELADIQICLWAMAEMDGIDVAEQVNRKMAINRSRPKSYYDAKLAEKATLGMPYQVDSADDLKAKLEEGS